MQNGDFLVKFFGRRGGGMRFKQEPIAELTAALDLYANKLAGTDAKKLKHDDLDAAKQAEMLGADWPQSLFDKYTAALAEGKIDLRIAKVPEEPTEKADKPAVKKVEQTEDTTAPAGDATAGEEVENLSEGDEAAEEASAEDEAAAETVASKPAAAFFWPTYPSAAASAQVSDEAAE